MIFDRIRSLARHTAVYGIGDVLGRAVSVLLLPLYTRMLSTEDNGVLILTFAFIPFCAVFYAMGIHQALIRRLSTGGGPDLQARRFSTAFWTILSVSLLLSALLWAAAAPLSRLLLSSAAYTDVFRMVSVVIFLDALGETFFTLCRAQQRSAVYAWVRLTQHTLQIGLTIFLIAGMGYGLRAVFWSNIASSAFAFLALLPVAWPNLRRVYDFCAIRDLLGFGLPFVPSTVAVLLTELSDRFLVKFYVGLEGAGIYGVAYKFGLPVLLVVRALRLAWAPAVLAVPDPQEARALCARVTTYFAVVAAFLVLCIAIFAREMILLVTGANAPTYLAGQGVVPLVALAYLCNGLYVLLTAGVYAEGRARVLPGIVGAGAAVNIVLNVLLLPRIGFMAAAWNTLAAYGLMALLLYLSMRRSYPVPFEYRRLAKVAIAGAVIYLTALSYAHDTTPAGIAARATFLLGYPLILWGWNFFEPGEWKDIRSMFRPGGAGRGAGPDAPASD